MADTMTLKEVRVMLEGALPREIKTAVNRAAIDAARKARTEGKREASAAYTLKRAKDRLSVQITKKDGVVYTKFSGEKGVKLWHFATSPRMPKGEHPGRRPGVGILVKVRLDGAYRPVTGPRGQKTFWFPTKQGNWIIGYRKTRSRYPVSVENMFGASPIQAVGRRDIIARIREHAEQNFINGIMKRLQRAVRG